MNTFLLIRMDVSLVDIIRIANYFFENVFKLLTQIMCSLSPFVLD